MLNVRLQDRPPDEVELATVLDRYYRNHAEALPSAEQARIAITHLKAGLPRLVSDLTPQAVREFTASMTPRTSGYIRRVLNVGKAAVAWAIREGELTHAPHIPLPGDSEARERLLSLEEAAALWRAVESEHVGRFLAVAFNTAARPDAVLDLDAGQIDFDRKLVHLNPPGRKQTKKRRPTLPLTIDLRNALAGVSGPVVAYRGGRLCSIKTAWRALRKRAGVDADVVPYTIRHTVASEMRSRGVPPWEVAGWLGHKIAEAKTTERYAKFAPDYMAKARKAVDAYMREVRAAC